MLQLQENRTFYQYLNQAQEDLKRNEESPNHRNKGGKHEKSIVTKKKWGDSENEDEFEENQVALMAIEAPKKQ